MYDFSRLNLTAKLYFGCLSFILGTVFGSFCNAWAWRIVHKESIAKGRSHCGVCGHTLSAGDLIPVVSYIVLKGRCRYCGEKISPRYLIAELILGGYFLSALLVHGFTLATLRYMVLGCILLMVSLVDLDTMEIPDGLIAAAGVLAALRFIEGAGVLQLALGLVPTLALMIIVIIMDRIMGRDTMGGGDIKLMAVLGLHFGLAGGIFILMAACIIGLIIAAINKTGRGKEFPFGPIISLAVWLMVLAGYPVINAYLSLF